MKRSSAPVDEMISAIQEMSEEDIDVWIQDANRYPDDPGMSQMRAACFERLEELRRQEQAKPPLVGGGS